MKIEAACPSCQQAYLLDTDSMSGEFFCPACSIPIPLKPPAAAERQSPVTPVVTHVAPGGAAAAVAATPHAEPVEPVEVVCPRCNLHFSPRKRTVDRASSERPTVLVVEDMDYFRQIAEDSLSEEYEVKTATCVADARNVLFRGGIDLMVLDLTLDGGDYGINLLREMGPKPCPILIFTARDESEMYGDSWDELRKLGADDIVIKGMNVGESLVRKVGTLLGRHWDDEDDID